ncbi:LysR family transcriptional regulator [Actinokineospora sp. UTMC 2448]|uniref:LysR family transcriptional regulator n=1 Tax=Actinokineospora sp. UTMC 2448 TaxID=2268449 RepID=UPI002164C289|nr:LysR family transcriptional regulator [Actinokineospora sp. UTMC 2448]
MRRLRALREVPMRLEIRHLRTLAAIEETGSLSRAAKRLGMSQPALTGLLQRMERSLGGRLFVRSERGSVPTPLGAEVLDEARVVLRGMDAIHARVDRWSRRGGDTQPVRLGGFCGFLHVPLGQWLGEQPWVPDVALCEDVDPRASVHKVAIAAVDLAVVYRSPTDPQPLPPNVRARTVHPAEPVFVGMAHDHPLAGQRAVDLAALTRYPWVDEPPGATPWSRYIAQVCREADIDFTHVHTTMSVVTVLDLLRGSTATGPVLATSREHDHDVVIRAVRDMPLWWELRLVYRAETVIADHIDQIHAQVIDLYRGRRGCNPAFDEWWSTSGAELASAG